METPIIPRSLPRDSWRWIWPDIFMRLLPFWIATLVVAHFMAGRSGASGLRAVGWSAPPQGWPAALAEGMAAGLVMLVCAIFWRARTAPRYRLPTHGDQALQTFFYLILNAPIEEVFWRGVVQTLAIRGLAALGAGHVWSAVLGLVAVSAVFGAYHRLGGYRWDFNVAAMLAGGVFGLLYLLLPGPSIVVPTIAHGFTTAGYLSWGDVALHLRSTRKKQRS
jgi:uncharacterized protein